MNKPEPTGYENEPDECFLPLPADLYCSFFHHQTLDSAEEYSYYQDILTKHSCQNILELGCGTGRISEYLFNAGLNMVGIDNSRERLSFSGHSRQVPSVEMDMLRLGFSRSFDATILPCNTLNLLQTEQRIKHCLAEIRQVLRSSGLLILHLFVPDRAMINNGGKKLFQFNLSDLADGVKLIRETIRTYDPGASLVTLEERYKIRRLSNNQKKENYAQTFQLAAFPAQTWLDIVSKSGFSVLSTHGHFNQSTFLENQDSTLLLVAQFSQPKNATHLS